MLFARAYRALEKLCFGAALIGFIALMGAVGVTMTDIVLRPSGGAVAGVVDIVQLLVMTGAFLALPYTFISDGHVSVDLVAQNLPPRASALLRLGAAILGTGLMALVMRYGWQSMMQQRRFGDVSQTIGIPMTWFWAPLLFGLALSSIVALFLAAREGAHLVTGRDPIGAGS